MKNLCLFLCFLSLGSCGVKGKPVPPEKPREMGIGKPQYKGVDAELNKDLKEDEEQKEKK